MSGCAAGNLGTRCEEDKECGDGLLCKGAQCTKARSATGEICVTDAGCTEGLQCLSGRCSAGIADSESCLRACTNVRRLAQEQAASSSNDKTNPGPNADSSTDRLALELTLNEIQKTCIEQCSRGNAIERVQCQQKADSLESLQACP